MPWKRQDGKNELQHQGCSGRGKIRIKCKATVYEKHSDSLGDAGQMCPAFFISAAEPELWKMRLHGINRRKHEENCKIS